MSEGAARKTIGWLVATRARLWATITFVVLAIVIGVIFSSQLFQQCVEANYAAPAHQSLEESVRAFFRIRWWCAGVFIDGNGAGITALFTVVLAISTIGLWGVTERTLLHAERSSERQLRAYIHPTSIKLTKPPGDVADWQAIIDLRNSGQTPAYNVVVTFEKGFRGELEADEVLQFSTDCSQQGPNVIGPGSEPSVTMDFHEVPIVWADWAIFRDANEMAYLWGRIDYVDAFGHKRFTTFQVVHHFGVIYDFVNCPCGNVTEFEAGRGARHVAAR